MLRFILILAVLGLSLSLALLIAIARTFSASAAPMHIVYAWSNNVASGSMIVVAGETSNTLTAHPLRDDGSELLRPTCSANGQVFAYIARNAVHALTADGREMVFPLSAIPTFTAQVQGLALADDGRMALISFSDERYKYPLYQLDFVTGEAQQIYTPSDYAVLPALSPDGRQTALVIGDSNRFQQMGVMVVKVQPADSSLPLEQPLIALGATMPAWSPDGGALTFTRYRAGHYALMIMDIRHGTRRPILDQGAIFDPVWSPDGQYVIYVTIVNGEERIALLDLSARRAENAPHRLLPHDSRDLLRFAPCALTFVPTRLLS